jgi:hypothetical protein
MAATTGYLRWRILARLRRFLRPIFRRPLPVFLTPTIRLLAELTCWREPI